MSRRAWRTDVPSIVSAPVLLAVAMLAGEGLPAPREVQVFGPQPHLGPWAALRVNHGADVHAWAGRFGLPVQVEIREDFVLTRVREGVVLAGVDAEITANDQVDDAEDIDARDRAADVADLAAARLAGVVV